MLVIVTEVCLPEITGRIGHEIIQHSFDSIGLLICRFDYSVAILVQAWPFLAFSLVAAMTDADEYAQLIALVQDTVESAMADVLSKLQTNILDILSNETATRSRVLIAWQAAHDARMAHAEANLKLLSDDLTARVELMVLYASSDSARLANAEANLKLLSPQHARRTHGECVKCMLARPALGKRGTQFEVSVRTHAGCAFAIPTVRANQRALRRTLGSRRSSQAQSPIVGGFRRLRAPMCYRQRRRHHRGAWDDGV